MNILFWNIRKMNTLFDVIVSFVLQEDIDIVFLAEFPTGNNNEVLLEDKLRSKVSPLFHYLKPALTRKIEAFSRISSPIFDCKEDKNRYSIFRLTDSNEKNQFNLFVCHLVDRINNSVDTRGQKASVFHSEICQYEKETECFNSVVFGDFNMNPYEKGMYYANMFNAVMEKGIANRNKRTVDGVDYSFFYNPMWSYLGDLGRGSVPGTYYFSDSKIDTLHWNMIDQVIIRPSVIPFFDENELKILNRTTQYSLLTKNGIIDNTHYSDHLPIKFKIKV